MYINFNKAKSFLRLLFRLVIQTFISFDFYIVVRRENAGTKWYQDIIQLMQRQHKE